MAPLIRPAAAGRSRTWRDIDLRWLAVCLVGAVVSAVAAWSVLVGRVPLDVVPPETVFAVACVILVAEWFIAAVMVAIYPEREADEAEPAAVSVPTPEPPSVTEPPAPAAKPPALESKTEPLALPPMKPAPLALAPAAPKPALPAASPKPAAAEVEELQERIEQLSAALTLTAAAENLQQVGAIAQQALAADIQYSRSS